MKHWLFALSLALGIGAQSAQAQVLIAPFRPTAPTRPTVSPYLNLNRGGSAGVNYFNLVRPQIETTRTLQTLGQEIQQIAPTGSGATGVITTGIQGSGVPNYMYYSHYFPSMPSGGVNPFVRRR